jgi:hypothetical protein
MLRGQQPSTWNGWVHGVAFLLLVATAVLGPLAMALAVRGADSWRPIALVSVVAATLVVVFMLVPWGNAAFTLTLVCLFGWVAVVAGRLRRA